MTVPLTPNGEPRWIRCYDSGPEDADRYTVVYTEKRGRGLYLMASADPFHPEGIGQHGETAHPSDRIDRSFNPDRWPPAIGRRHPSLGRRIPFAHLPEPVRRLVSREYAEIWA